MTSEFLKRELVRYYRWLRRYGLNDSHSGNASVRDGERIWITPSGAGADMLRPQALIPCALGPPPHYGEGASRDAALHLAVYQKNPRAGALLHSHGPYSVAMTMDGQDFVPPDFEGSYYFGTVPVVSVPFAEYFALATEQVSALLAGHPVAVVRGHGVYVQAPTLDLAYKWTCTLELSAKTAFIAHQSGKLG